MAALPWIKRELQRGLRLLEIADQTLRGVQQRRRQIEEQTVGWLTALTNSLKVTGSLVDAFQQTLALTEGPLAQELDLMLKECRMGLPLPDALRGMTDRIRSEVFSTIITVIMIGSM